MLLKQLSNIFRTAIFVVSGLVLVIFSASAVQAWTGPTGDPPTNNVAAPLNQGTQFNGDVQGLWNQLKIKLSPCVTGQLLGWNGTGVVCTSTSVGTGISGTVNYIPKFSTANSLGNSAMFDYGGNIGLGTTTPLNKLSVLGSIFAANGVRVSNESEGSSGLLCNNAPWYGIGRTNVANGESGHIGYMTQLAGYYGLLFAVADAQSVIKTNGQWGINTMGPNISVNATMEVNKQYLGSATRFRITDLSANPEIQLQYGVPSGSDNAHWGLYANNTVNDSFNIWGTTDGTYANGANYLTILTSGNVGLGKALPVTRLDVAGTVSSTGLQVNGAAAVSSLKSTNLAGSGSRCLQTDLNGNITATASACGTGSGSTGGVNYGLAGQAAYYPANGTSVTGTSALYVAASKNVGINTSTPLYKFVVQGGDGNNPGFFLNSGAANTGTFISLGRSGGLDSLWGVAGIAANYWSSAAAGDTVIRAVSGKLDLAAGYSSTGVILDSAGRVSIGTTTLNGLFEVGTSSPSLVVDDTTGFVGINNSNPGKRLQVGSGPVYFPASAVAITENSADAVRSPAAGSGIEFGIPPSTASYGEAGAIGYESRKNNPYRGIELYAGRTNDSSVWGWGDALPVMKITSVDGHVGVGTWEPNYFMTISNELLYWQRNTQVADKSVWVNLNTLNTVNDNGISWSVGPASTSQKYWRLYRPANTTDLVFATGTAAAPAMTLAANGNIGIGATPSIAKLQVNANNEIISAPAVYGQNTYTGVPDTISQVIGVRGDATESNGTNGIIFGVMGTAVVNSVYSGAAGVIGSSNNGVGIWGQSTNNYSGYFTGGNGLKSVNNTDYSTRSAIYGGNFFSGATNGTSRVYGIVGEAGATPYAGSVVAGVMGNATGTNSIGVYGYSQQYWGVYGNTITGWAGYFTGGNSVYASSFKVGSTTVTVGGSCTGKEGTIVYYNAHFYGCTGVWKQLDN